MVKIADPSRVAGQLRPAMGEMASVPNLLPNPGLSGYLRGYPLVFEVDMPRWTILWGRIPPAVPWVMRAVSGGVLHDMKIAVPIALLSAWLAVSHGLRPLRRLSQAIAARGPADLSPVDIEARHAELKPLVTALDDLLMRLRYKVESEQMFVANAAHELRTPLAAITAQAHALVKAGTATEQVELGFPRLNASERVFERFYRGAGQSDARGGALGLTVVKQAATRLNGRILVSPGLGGRGCSFVVEIQER